MSINDLFEPDLTGGRVTVVEKRYRMDLTKEEALDVLEARAQKEMAKRPVVLSIAALALGVLLVVVLSDVIGEWPALGVGIPVILLGGYLMVRRIRKSGHLAKKELENYEGE